MCTDDNHVCVFLFFFSTLVNHCDRRHDFSTRFSFSTGLLCCALAAVFVFLHCFVTSRQTHGEGLTVTYKCFCLDKPWKRALGRDFRWIIDKYFATQMKKNSPREQRFDGMLFRALTLHQGREVLLVFIRHTVKHVQTSALLLDSRCVFLCARKRRKYQEIHPVCDRLLCSTYDDPTCTDVCNRNRVWRRWGVKRKVGFELKLH